MKKSDRLWPLLFFVAMLTTFSASAAWAKDCGDTSGPGGTDVPCECGDSVTTDTVLNASDPVLNAVCVAPATFVGLGVAAGVTLDASMLNMQCGPQPPAPAPPTIGLYLANSVRVIRGTIRGCSEGIFGYTNGSTVERAVVRESPLAGGFISGVGIFLIGNGNTLLKNQCFDNTNEGILVWGNFNRLRENHCLRNGFDGIAVGGIDGVPEHGVLNALGRNQAHFNGRHGIFAPGYNITDRHNYTHLNEAPPQCLVDSRSGDTFC